jgi:hypothetical protein
MRGGVDVAVTAAALGSAGCVIETTHTDLAFHDVHQVALASQNATLPPDATEVTIADAAFAPEKGALTRYTLTATRAPDGTIAFEWKLHAPLLNGEHQTVVEVGPTDLGEAPWATPDMLRAPTLRMPGCAALHKSTAKGVFVGYHATEWAPCEQAVVAVPFALETPWSNVKELHQRVVPEKAIAGGLAIVNTVLIGGVGALFLALPQTHAAGWIFTGLAGGIDLLLLPTLLAPERDTIVFPH